MDPLTPCKTTWKSSILITSWIIEGLLLIIVIAFDISVLAKSSMVWNYDYDVTMIGVIASVTSFAGITLTLNITALVLFVKDKLRPIIYFFFELTKVVLWVVMLVVNVMVYIYTYSSIGINDGYHLRTQYSTFLVGTLVEICVLLLTSFCTLIYASIVLQRHRRDRRASLYVPTSNTEGSPDAFTPPPYQDGPSQTQSSMAKLGKFEPIRISNSNHPIFKRTSSPGKN